MVSRRKGYWLADDDEPFDPFDDFFLAMDFFGVWAVEVWFLEDSIVEDDESLKNTKNCEGFREVWELIDRKVVKVIMKRCL